MPASRTLPMGTVTLLLADQEASASAWQRNRAAMAEVAARLARLVQDEIAAHHGVKPLEQGEGDSFVAAFVRASDAAACALALQLATATDDWPGDLQPRLRMAIHTGEVELRDPGNYMGTTINRCGRLRSLAAGGQVLVSRTTADLLYDTMPPGAKLLDLGPHRLRGFDRPEVVFQLCHPDLPGDFPPILDEAAPAVSRPGAPPVPLNATIGRDAEIREVVSLLRRGVRLVTITGPGGVGKTRLALEIASTLADDYTDYVHFLPLASIDDPGVVMPTLAQLYGIPTEGHSCVVDSIVDHLRMRHALLVVDNFEHVMEVAPAVGVILDNCPRIQILITSRHLLHLQGEYAFDLRPLATPPLARGRPVLGAIKRAPAVQLFVERARHGGAQLNLSEDNAGAVAELCRRLDGLPLAIELAAARARLLPPAALLSRLDQRLDVLAVASADAAERHHTLKATIDWSHELLDEPERAAFARLSVFSGGCTLAAAEAVCRFSDQEPDSVETLSSLLEQSLLVVTDDTATEPRLTMLRTVRAYAWEQLALRGETAEAQRRHLGWFRDLMDRAVPHLSGPDQRETAIRLDPDRDNIRGAFRYAVETRDAEAAARIVFASYIYASIRDSVSELRDWIDQSEALVASAPAEVIGRHHLAGAVSAVTTGDVERAAAYLASACDVFDDTASFEEGLALLGRGIVAGATGDDDRASDFLRRAAAVFESIGNDWGLGYAESTMGDRALRTGDLDGAGAHHERALALARRMENGPLAGRSLTRLALAANAMGDLGSVTDDLEQAVAIYRAIGYRSGVLFCLDAGAIAAVSAGLPALAARAAGSAAKTREEIASAVWPTMRPMLEASLHEARDRLGDREYGEAERAGAAMPPEQAISEVLASLRVSATAA